MPFVNRSLLQTPRAQRAITIPSKDTLSILDWLRKQGRLIEQAPEPVAALASDDLNDIDEFLDDDGYEEDFMDDDD